MLSEEELRRLIESLSIREIIEPALDNWVQYESTGKTVINLKNGKVIGISLKSNELIDLNHDNEHIEQQNNPSWSRSDFECPEYPQFKYFIYQFFHYQVS